VPPVVRTITLTVVRIIALILLGCACIVLYPYLNQEYLSGFIDRNRIGAPLAFIAVCAFKPLLFFLPSLGLTIVAGTLFGALWGTIYVAIGGALSTLVGFFFAKWFGRDLIQPLLNNSKATKILDIWSKEYGKKAVLIMRLCNMPWDIVSYWAGLTDIPFKDFYVASLIALVPTSFLYTYFGTQLFTPMSIGFIVSLAMIIMMGSLPYVWKYVKKCTHE
jgi:uncharacterized membrane protein YdjX (TVP38/TMEM64 family)